MMNLSYKMEFREYKKMKKVHKHSILTMIYKKHRSFKALIINNLLKN